MINFKEYDKLNHHFKIHYDSPDVNHEYDYEIICIKCDLIISRYYSSSIGRYKFEIIRPISKNVWVSYHRHWDRNDKSVEIDFQKILSCDEMIIKKMLE